MILQDPHDQTIVAINHRGVMEYRRRSIIEQAKAEMRGEMNEQGRKEKE
jgi:hypothetical protein